MKSELDNQKLGKDKQIDSQTRKSNWWFDKGGILIEVDICNSAANQGEMVDRKICFARASHLIIKE